MQANGHQNYELVCLLAIAWLLCGFFVQMLCVLALEKSSEPLAIQFSLCDLFFTFVVGSSPMVSRVRGDPSVTQHSVALHV